MAKKIVVLLLHGAGVHVSSESNKDRMLEMSELLQARLTGIFQHNGQGDLNDFAFKSVFWDEDSNLHDREHKLIETVGLDGVRFRSIFTLPGFGTLREFMFTTVGDLAAYQPVSNIDRPFTSRDQFDTYTSVHAVVADALKQCVQDHGGDARLVVIAHSLGTIIASNYIYDWQNDRPRSSSGTCESERNHR